MMSKIPANYPRNRIQPPPSESKEEKARRPSFHERIHAIPRLESLWGVKATLLARSSTLEYQETAQKVHNYATRGAHLADLLRQPDLERFKYALSLVPPDPLIHIDWMTSSDCTPSHILILKDIYLDVNERAKLFPCSNNNLFLMLMKQGGSAEELMALYEVCPEAKRDDIFDRPLLSDFFAFDILKNGRYVLKEKGIDKEVLLFLIEACPKEKWAQFWGVYKPFNEPIYSDVFYEWHPEKGETFIPLVREIMDLFPDRAPIFLPFVVREYHRLGLEAEAQKVISEQLSSSNRDEFLSHLLEKIYPETLQSDNYKMHYASSISSLQKILPAIIEEWQQKGGDILHAPLKLQKVLLTYCLQSKIKEVIESHPDLEDRKALLSPNSQNQSILHLLAQNGDVSSEAIKAINNQWPLDHRKELFKRDRTYETSLSLALRRPDLTVSMIESLMSACRNDKEKEALYSAINLLDHFLFNPKVDLELIQAVFQHCPTALKESLVRKFTLRTAASKGLSSEIFRYLLSKTPEPKTLFQGTNPLDALFNCPSHKQVLTLAEQVVTLVELCPSDLRAQLSADFDSLFDQILDESRFPGLSQRIIEIYPQVLDLVPETVIFADQKEKIGHFKIKFLLSKSPTIACVGIENMTKGNFERIFKGYLAPEEGANDPLVVLCHALDSQTTNGGPFHLRIEEKEVVISFPREHAIGYVKALFGTDDPLTFEEFFQTKTLAFEAGEPRVLNFLDTRFLESHSNYFKALWKGGFQERDTQVTSKLVDITRQDFDQIVEHLLKTVKGFSSFEEAAQLVILADYFDILSLKENAISFIIDEIERENNTNFSDIIKEIGSLLPPDILEYIEKLHH